jgi:uncharacterized Ntn-hydrolase superfamily protein
MRHRKGIFRRVRAAVHSLLLVLLLAPWTAGRSGDRPLLLPPVSTFSIVAIDPATGDLGVAVASRYFSVGSVVPWAEAGVGAVATQANVNVGYGPQALRLLEQGLSAQQVLQRLLADDRFPEKEGRQVAIVDARGNIAAYTGPQAPAWAGDRQGKTWSAQGNILVGPQVIEAMGKAFEASHGELAERLYAALAAGDAAGGDRRGRQSASLLVVRKQGGRNLNNDRYVYINVDDHPQPLVELRRLLDLALGYNYEDRAYKLIEQNQLDPARLAAQQAAQYLKGRPEPHLALGFLDYVRGQRTEALAEFRTARRLSPHFSQEFRSLAEFVPAFKPVLQDHAFLQELFPNRSR